MRRLFPVTLGMTARLLYDSKRFSEVMDLAASFPSPTIKGSLVLTGNIYAHYCQTLGECGQFPAACKYAAYAYANLFITEDSRNAAALKKSLWKDFKIQV